MSKSCGPRVDSLAGIYSSGQGQGENGSVRLLCMRLNYRRRGELILRFQHSRLTVTVARAKNNLTLSILRVYVRSSVPFIVVYVRAIIQQGFFSCTARMFDEMCHIFIY